MATVKDYVKGENIDPVTGKSIKTVTTGTSGSQADLQAPIQTSNGSFQAPGFGSLQDQSMELYPDDPTAAPKSNGAPRAQGDIQGKGGGSASFSSKSGTSQQDSVANAKQAGQVTTFGNFLKAAKAGSMLLGMMGIPEAALAQATGQVDYTGDFGNYNQRAGWNDAYDAGLKEAAKNGITDPTQANAYAQQFAQKTLPDPTTTAPLGGSDQGKIPGPNDPTTPGAQAFDELTDPGGTTAASSPTPGAAAYDELMGPLASGGSGGSGSKNTDYSGTPGGQANDELMGGFNSDSAPAAPAAPKGDGAKGGGGNSGNGGSGSGLGGQSGQGNQGARSGFESGGEVTKDPNMASEATYMMPKSATSFNRGGSVTKQAPAKGWMQGATQNAHGQFAAKAKAAGMTTQAFAQLHRGSPGMLGEQARLALVLMSKGGGDAKPSMATGGAVVKSGYEDGGTVIPQAPVGPDKMAPRPDGTPAPSGDAGPLPESGDPAGAAPPGAGASADDGRFDPSASQIADDGVTDNQPINADEGEYVLNKQSVQVLGIGFMNWLDNPQNAAELADVLQAIEGASESSETDNGGGAGGGMPPVGGASPPADPTAADASGPDAPADLSAMSMGPGAGAPMPPPGGAGAPPPFMKKKAPVPPVAA